MIDNKDRDLVAAVFGLGDKLALRRIRTSRHTVVAGVRSQFGAMYFGVNCDSIHGTCAEVVAYANAVLACDPVVEAIVAVLIDVPNEARVISPCGNCRQILFELAPDVAVIVNSDDGLVKLPISEMLPLPYRHR